MTQSTTGRRHTPTTRQLQIHGGPGRSLYTLRIPGQLPEATIRELREALMEHAVDWLRDRVRCVRSNHPAVRVTHTTVKPTEQNPTQTETGEIKFTVTVNETMSESEPDELQDELIRGLAEGVLFTDIDPESIDADYR